MRTYIVIVIAALLGAAVSAHAADMPAPPPVVEAPPVHVIKTPHVVKVSHPVSAGCDSKCQAYKNAGSRGPVPYRDATACVYFKQARVDNVVIRFYDAAGHEFDANDPLHNRKAAGQEDKICPGIHWFKKVLQSGGHAELCNSFESRRLEIKHVQIILSLGRTPVGKWVHLDKPRS